VYLMIPHIPRISWLVSFFSWHMLSLFMTNRDSDDLLSCFE